MADFSQPSPAIADSGLTPERIARLRELHESGTPGPWRREDHHHDGLEAWEVVTDDWVVACCPDDEQDDTKSRADAELIAAAVNALPDLLAAVIACEKVRGAFAFMPALNEAAPGYTADDIRREVNDALDWCLTPVYAALDGTTEAEARQALGMDPASSSPQEET